MHHIHASKPQFGQMACLGCSMRVLSGTQVSFNVLIPCMLFTKVAATLAESHDWTLLAIPAVAVIQVWATAVSCVNADQAHERQGSGCSGGSECRLVP
jgi:hypothetical protein